MIYQRLTMRTLSTILLILFIIACRTTVASAQVVVIAHPSVPVETIDKADLLDFYTGDTRSWEDDVPVTVFDLKPKGTVKDTFYSFLGKSSSRMKSIWLKRKLSGEGDPPTSFETEEEVLEHVAATPGAIGFVSKGKVGTTVKILVEIGLDEG